MSTSTLFGHLVSRFSVHPENLATEALGYVLRRSAPARNAVRDLLGQVGINISDDLAYQNQMGGADAGQPDVVGLDYHGYQRLIMEAKFWANLTDHQPVAYLKRVPQDGVLLFVAPAAHATLLWGELMRRCTQAGLTGDVANIGELAIPRLTLNDGRHLALVSWRALLGVILSRLDAVGDRATYGDVQQLMGLCEHMDTTAFIPITSDELTSPLYRRVLQFAEIADEAVTSLVDRGQADIKGLVRQPFKGVAGRYFRLLGHGAYLSCDLTKWNVLAATPIWLTFGQGWILTSDVRDALSPLAAHTPPRLFTGDKGTLVLPIYVPTLETREHVLDAVIGQLITIADRLPVIAPEPLDTPPSTLT